VIEYPPKSIDDKLYFALKRCDGISIESEGYCALGLSSDPLKIVENK
jgi:hypothetical protein